MKNNFLFLFLTSLIFLLCGFSQAIACSCITLSPCLQNTYADAVFIGKITTVERKGLAAVHTVEIEKAFNGIENKKTVEIYTDQITSCAFSMSKNEKYLIFANINSESGLITTDYCSGTKKVEESKAEIEYLESIKNAIDGNGVVKGSVLEHDLINKFTVKPWKPEEINKVYLETENGEKFETDIGADGKYSFRNLLGGWYYVSIFVPERLITSGESEEESDYIFKNGFREKKRRIKVPGSGCEASSYYSLLVNGIITGKVVDSNQYLCQLGSRMGNLSLMDTP